ncbi:hypothetical protein BAE44_0002133 [Dichanthelium oligosanthes]|uniref:Uncharacterized protein n=1 Tax=Dichanthelium oligosanthes TaxID=888268 RepID=A0A1E5WHH1_9POAL|nr:hypothetical protein BAE44_0002133 [Dichanthelium oligosanthes]
MAAVDLSKLVKEKRFWVASFLVAWAAALQVASLASDRFASCFRSFNPPPPGLRISFLSFFLSQGHMMWMQRQDTFKHKFVGDASDTSDAVASSSDSDSSS